MGCVTIALLDRHPSNHSITRFPAVARRKRSKRAKKGASVSHSNHEADARSPAHSSSTTMLDYTPFSLAIPNSTRSTTVRPSRRLFYPDSYCYRLPLYGMWNVNEVGGSLKRQQHASALMLHLLSSLEHYQASLTITLPS